MTSEEIERHEPLFHRAERGTARADFAAMMTDDFWEVGASGNRYDREYVLDVLEERHSEPQDENWEVSDFRCRALGPDAWLAAYTLREPGRVTHRATIWVREEGRLKALYHQGTLAP